MLDNKEIVKEIFFTNNYPTLKQHPVWVYDANQTYKKLSKEELDAYYNMLLNLPSSDEKEKHRHTATAAVLRQHYPRNFVRELGEFKEYSDQKEGQTKENSFFDMVNNERGMDIGEQFPNINRTSIYDYIMKNIRNDIERK